MEYSFVAIIGLIVLVITNYELFFDKNFQVYNQKALRTYRFFAIAVGLFYIVDLLWGFLDPLENKIYVTIDTNFYFVFLAFVLFAWTQFVMCFIDKVKAFTIVVRVLGVLFLAGGLILITINFFEPILFSYKADQYVPSVTRFGYLIFQVISFFAIGIYAFVFSFRGNNLILRRRYLTVAISSIFLAIAVLLQIFGPLYPFYTMGLIAANVILYVFIVATQKEKINLELSESISRVSKQNKEIKHIKELAYIDPLTGVKNKHAFVELENNYDVLIRENKIQEFALLVFDLNNLKLINDTHGHEAGDKYLIDSCQLIKEIFTNTTIYRYGGDEFVILLEGEQLKDRYNLVDKFNEVVDQNRTNNGPIVALGIADYIPGKDNTLRSVFTRADERMYVRKRQLKENKDSSNDLGNKATGASLVNLRYEMYELFYYDSGISMLDMLNGSNCDEILEININDDTFTQIFHQGSKYFVPSVGHSYRDLLDFTHKYIVHPDDRGAYMSLMNPDGFFERLKNSRIPNFDFAHFRYKLQNGSYCWVEQIVICGDEFGLPKGVFRMYVIDINNIKGRLLGNIVEESIFSSGEYLTGLYSSREFVMRATDMVLENKDKNWCVLALDIEHFKLFDEWFGREKGNELLNKIGAVLKDFEKNNAGLAGYLGQDDFSVLCEYNMDLINDLYAKVNTTINSFGLSAGFLPAFGISVLEKDISVVDALDRATIAASNAKGDIKHRIFVYDYDAQFQSEHELRTLTEFMHALKNEEVQFFVQPQVRIPGGQILGGEALTRWLKSDGTFVPPNDFIPVLEKYGFITDLDKYIWEKVCKWLGERIKNKKNVVPISVNVSRIDIFNIDIANYFTELCEKYDINHNLLKIEITESAYAENMNVVDKLVNDLRNRGFMVLMDDFGSGYSSLNMLSTLKISAIKLDAYFLQIEDKSYRKGINILESVINMAKTMALPIIVEGVETKNQVDFLHECGVNFVQGYYYYKALPVETFEKLINEKKNVDDRGFKVNINEQFRVREFLDQNLYSDSMLNNILGSVAIYSVSKESIDIIRYNQQFMDTVNVPDFGEKLAHIENTMPEEDRQKAYDAFKRAKENRLLGATETLRFNTVYGILTSYRMHFYYLGKKEGTDRFYGSATNITQLVDLMEGKELVAKYSKDNLILIGKVSGKWQYTVVSHELSNIIGLSPKELEEELNNGAFYKRIVGKKELSAFIKEVENTPKDQKRLFMCETIIVNNKKQKIDALMEIEYVGDQSNNFQYILRTTRINKK